MDENENEKKWTVDVNWLKKYTIQFACLYLFKKCEREKQKTENEIYKMRIWLVNSFARYSFKRRKFVKNFFTLVSSLKFCNCVKKFVSLSWKLNAGKMKNPNWLPDLQKKNKNKNKMKPKKILKKGKKRKFMTSH